MLQFRGFIDHHDVLPRHIHPRLRRQFDVVDLPQRVVDFFIEFPAEYLVRDVKIILQWRRDRSGLSLGKRESSPTQGNAQK